MDTHKVFSDTSDDEFVLLWSDGGLLGVATGAFDDDVDTVVSVDLLHRNAVDLAYKIIELTNNMPGNLPKHKIERIYTP